MPEGFSQKTGPENRDGNKKEYNVYKNLSGEIREGIHYLPVRVYYSDTDAGGIVYHARYLDMAEHARTEMVRTLGGSQHNLMVETGTAFVVRSLDISYHRPARLDDELMVATTVKQYKAVYLVFDQKIYRNEELIAELEVKAASISLQTGRPVPQPEEWKNLILKHLPPQK